MVIVCYMRDKLCTTVNAPTKFRPSSSVLVTLTLMQGHTGSAKAKHHLDNLTKQAICIKLATAGGHCLHDLDFESVYIA